MIQLVIGGSASGKSAYAESLLLSLAEKNGAGRYYLAAMQDESAEGKRRIERHQRMRDGKGFFTIEQPTDIHRALERMQAGKKAALLECVSNLTANEMFAGGEVKSENFVVEKIVREIRVLSEGVEDLVIVGCNVFEDGVEYDEMTMRYIRAIGRIHEELALLSDRVVELVVGIPVVVKC